MFHLPLILFYCAVTVAFFFNRSNGNFVSTMHRHRRHVTKMIWILIKYSLHWIRNNLSWISTFRNKNNNSVEKLKSISNPLPIQCWYNLSSKSKYWFYFKLLESGIMENISNISIGKPPRHNKWLIVFQIEFHFHFHFLCIFMPYKFYLDFFLLFVT